MSWIYLNYGRPGEGKSIDATRTAIDLLLDYEKIEKKYPELPKRTLWSNLKFSGWLEKIFINKIQYWENPKQLFDLKDVDIIWDEIARHLPSDSWKDTPDKLRALFSMHRKRGIRIFANTQDWKAVDINFRRMVGVCYKLHKWIGSRDKSVSLPPVKTIWGIVSKTEFNPDDLEQENGKEDKIKRKYLFTIPKFFWITRELVEAYDTTQEIPPYEPDGLEHIEKECFECGYTKVIHKSK